MIRVSDLTKRFGTKVAVDRLAFEVERGQIVGFLGPNGAGKSTTLRMLAGFLRPSSGAIWIDGIDIQAHPERARQRLGYMPEASPAYPELRVSEYLRFRARLKRVPSARRDLEIDRVMSLSGVAERADAVVGHLSKGFRQRLGIADALLADPPLLILDEPTAGLDPNQIRQVRDLIRSLADSHTVLLSTHILSEVEMLCSRALVVHRGRLLSEGTLDQLRGLREPTDGLLILKEPHPSLTSLLAPACTVVSVDESAEQTTIRLRLREPKAGMSPVLAALGAARVSVHEARLLESRLEDVFAALTSEPTEQAALPEAEST